MSESNQWIRRCSLVLYTGDKGIDLSEFRIAFQIQNADVESPNTAIIRVYNLSTKTMAEIATVTRYSTVTLNAGYQDNGSVKGNYGVIFQGQVKQYRYGKEDNKTTYIDIFAADGDIGYNYGIMNENLAKGQTLSQHIQKAVDAMPGITLNQASLSIPGKEVPMIRGSVMVGMARTQLRNLASTLNASWSIQNGQVQIQQTNKYNLYDQVEINSLTGMIGIPEQTEEGIKVQCLLNSKIRIGSPVKINNKDITQILQQNPALGPLTYNQWAPQQYNLAPLSKDGTYMVFVAEHEGDTRGNPWYTNLICLAVDPSSFTVKAQP